MANQNDEKAKMNLMGQSLQFVWKSGGVKIFTICLLIIALTLFAFSFRVNPIITLILFSAFAGAIVIFLAWYIHIDPSAFQDSGTWLGYQKMLVGNKQKGLYEMQEETQLFQPEIQTTIKTITGKARIIKG